MASRVAVIAGATRGWGLAIAEGLAASGVSVVVNARGPEADVVATRIRDEGGTAISVRVSADEPAGVDALLEHALEAFGHVDIWVNSLGIQRPAKLVELEFGTWQEVLRVQLTSIFLGSQRAARQMISQGTGGRIINVVGGGAYGVPGAGAHAASKGGALAATFSWAEELREHSITVNAIRGGVQSQGMEAYLRGVGVLAHDQTLSAEEFRRIGFYRRIEAAPLAVWLADPGAADVTGLHIGIDGPRVVVYGRVARVLELEEASGWTVDKLRTRLQPALPAVSNSRDVQRRPPDGRVLTFDDRI